MKHALSRGPARRPRQALGAGVRALGSILLVCALASPALAEGAKPGAVIYDALIERPIGVVETVIGLGVATIAYPVGLASNKSEAVVDRCISDPARYTFTRPLGKFGKRPANLCSPVGLSWGLVGVSIGLVERPLGLLFGGSPFGQDQQSTPDELEIDVPRSDRTTQPEIAI